MPDGKLPQLRDQAHHRHDATGADADHQRQRDQVELIAAQQSSQPRDHPVRSLAIDDMRQRREHESHFFYEEASAWQ